MYIERFIPGLNTQPTNEDVRHLVPAQFPHYTIIASGAGKELGVKGFWAEIEVHDCDECDCCQMPFATLQQMEDTTTWWCEGCMNSPAKFVEAIDGELASIVNNSEGDWHKPEANTRRIRESAKQIALYARQLAKLVK